MRKFGVLGALVFALLVAASPVMGANCLMFSGRFSATRQITSGQFATDAGYVKLKLATWSPAPCSAWFTLDGSHHRHIISGADQVQKRSLDVSLSAGVHSFRIATDCAWTLAVLPA
jgi:hypothetical protein